MSVHVGLLLLSWRRASKPGTSPREDTVGRFQVNDLRKGLKKILNTGCSTGFSNKTIYVLAWIHGGIATCTRRHQQPFLDKPLSCHINISIYLYSDHAPQVKIWLIVKHENSFQTAEAILSRAESTKIRQVPSLWASRLRRPHSWRLSSACLQGDVHCST